MTEPNDGSGELREVVVASSTDVVEGGRWVVRIGDVEIGIFRIDGSLVAWENRCAHAGGPVCQGQIIPRVVEKVDADQVSHGYEFSDEPPHIVCPWHGYEYSLATGQHPGKANVRLRGFGVREELGKILVQLAEAK